jgi:AraC family transcriptional regulator
MKRESDATAWAMAGPPLPRLISKGDDWSIAEYPCHAGPADKAFEEMHKQFTIAAVVEGSFNYRTEAGRALLYPGAVMLGNFGKCFECGHDHSVGDRCIAFHFEPEFFAEIAATAAGCSQYTFPVAMLPAAALLTPFVVRFETLAAGACPLEIEETVARVGEAMLATLSGHTRLFTRVSARDEKRIAQVLRHIEDHAAEQLNLDGLAKLAVMSKYHFLRTFQRIVGMPPYRFLLFVRMRRAAVRLVVSSETVTTIAFEAGFGDLSGFNRRFRNVFGMTPLAHRRQGTTTKKRSSVLD